MAQAAATRQCSHSPRGGLRTASFAWVVLAVWTWGAAPVHGQERAAEDLKIRFTAWNVRNFLHVAAPPAEGVREKPKPPGEVNAVVSILARIRPDVLGLCEMGSPADLEVLRERLRAEGLDLPHTEHVEAADRSRHLALLSRFAITARHSSARQTYLLDDTRLPVERGFLDVSLKITEGYTLRVAGAHLKSRLDVTTADQDLMRRNEAHLLRKWVDAALAEDPAANLLVYGDFNDTRDQPSVRAIKGVRGAPGYLTEIAAGDSAGDRWTFYYPEADEYSRIDFLLASKGLLPEIAEAESSIYDGRDWSAASDHRAVTAVIRPRGK